MVVNFFDDLKLCIISIGMYHLHFLGHCIRYDAFVLRLQILKILEHGSVRGLSVLSFELEVVGYTIALAYCLHGGLPFSAYGELAFLLIQGMSSASHKLLVNSNISS